jgi:hypothetical protein
VVSAFDFDGFDLDALRRELLGGSAAWVAGQAAEAVSVGERWCG